MGDDGTRLLLFERQRGMKRVTDRLVKGRERRIRE